MTKMAKIDTLIYDQNGWKKILHWRPEFHNWSPAGD